MYDGGLNTSAVDVNKNSCTDTDITSSEGNKISWWHCDIHWAQVGF